MLLELADRRAKRREHLNLPRQATALKTPDHRRRFAEKARSDYGRIVVSAGSLLELDRSIDSVVRNRSKASNVDAKVAAVWESYDDLAQTLGIPFDVEPFCRSSDRAVVARFGLVDAHLLAILETDREVDLTSTDRPLLQHARELVERRRRERARFLAELL